VVGFRGEEGFRMLKHEGNFSTLIGQLGADAAKIDLQMANGLLPPPYSGPEQCQVGRVSRRPISVGDGRSAGPDKMDGGKRFWLRIEPATGSRVRI
jgi:hypothetical protein